MEDIKKTIIERVNNRYLCGFVIAFVLWNFKAISIFVFGKYDIVEKIEFISKTYTDIYYLLIYPAISSLAYFIIAPWMSLVSEWYYNIPNYRIEVVKQNYNQKILEIRKEELETKQETVKIQEEIKAQDRTLNQHDIALFEKNDSNLSEKYLVNFIENVTNAQRCYLSDTNKLEEYIRLGKLNSNTYINNDLSNAHIEFIGSLSKLLGFIAQNFFSENSTENNDTIIGLYPEMRHQQMFRDHVNNLVKITDEVLKKYSEYRMLVKRLLEI